MKCMLRDTACNLNKCKSHNAEDMHIIWTNHRNITIWFDNWEHDLVELGFAVCDATIGKIHIPEEIGNFDKTCLNLEGSSTNRAGRPEAFIYDQRFPVVGKATCKTSLTSMLITGSTAAGEAFPPHIQYKTNGPTRGFFSSPADAHRSNRGSPSDKADKICARVGIGRVFSFFCLASPPSAAMAAVIVVLTVIFVAQPSSSSCPPPAIRHRPSPHSFVCVISSLLCPLTR